MRPTAAYRTRGRRAEAVSTRAESEQAPAAQGDLQHASGGGEDQRFRWQRHLTRQSSFAQFERERIGAQKPGPSYSHREDQISRQVGAQDLSLRSEERRVGK